MGTDELLYLRFANTMIEPIWNRNHIAYVQITMAESFGVEDRGHFYDPVGALRDVVVNHLMQVVALAAMEAPAGSDARHAQGRQVRACSARSRTPTPRTTCAASTTATCDIDGVAKDSTTETYAALRLDIDNWRWSGVPWFIRTGKKLPRHADRAARRVPRPAAPGLHGARAPPPEPNQFVVKLDPATGTRVILDAHRADAAGPRRSRSTSSSPSRAARRRPPTRCCCSTRMRGDSTRFTRQDGVEETWRIFEPLLREAAAGPPLRPGLVGPAEADGRGGLRPWHGPGRS